MGEVLNKRLMAKNSVLLYVRMLFTMWINLYATRLTLENLGVNDYGVYGIVGSVVNVVSIFGGGATSAVQRFITFEFGKKEGDANAVFCTALNLIIIISIITAILLEVGGVWMLYNTIKIPRESIEAAFWVYQLSVLTCLVSLLSVPYNALIIAHEKMNAFAAISVIQVLLNCGAAYCLSFFHSERLIYYSIFMAGVALLIRVFYQVYCHIKFEESRYHFSLNIALLKDMGKFAGVSSLSGLLQSVLYEGLSIAYNISFGVAITAVHNLASQLKLSILSFGANVNKAIAPQITKLYAANEFAKYEKLVTLGTKLNVFAILLVLIPFYAYTPLIMSFWLGNVPPYATEISRAFSTLTILYIGFEPMKTGALASKHITKFLLIPDILFFVVFPVFWGATQFFKDPMPAIWATVVIEYLICFVRGYYAVQVASLNGKLLLTHMLLPVGFVVLLSIPAAVALLSLVDSSIVGAITFTLSYAGIWFILVYFVGLSRQERLYIRSIFERG